MVSITINKQGTNSQFIAKSSEGSEVLSNFLTNDNNITLLDSIYQQLSNFNFPLIAELTFLDNQQIKFKLGMTNDEVITDYELNVISVPTLPLALITGNIKLPVLIPLINSMNASLKPFIYSINFMDKTMKIAPIIPELDGMLISVEPPSEQEIAVQPSLEAENLNNLLSNLTV